MTYQDILQDYLTNYKKSLICISNAGVDRHSTFGHLPSFENWFPVIGGLRD